MKKRNTILLLILTISIRVNSALPSGLTLTEQARTTLSGTSLAHIIVSSTFDGSKTMFCGVKDSTVGAPLETTKVYVYDLQTDTSSIPTPKENTMGGYVMSCGFNVSPQKALVQWKSASDQRQVQYQNVASDGTLSADSDNSTPLDTHNADNTAKIRYSKAKNRFFVLSSEGQKLIIGDPTTTTFTTKVQPLIGAAAFDLNPSSSRIYCINGDSLGFIDYSGSMAILTSFSGIKSKYSVSSTSLIEMTPSTLHTTRVMMMTSLSTTHWLVYFKLSEISTTELAKVSSISGKQIFLHSLLNLESTEFYLFSASTGDNSARLKVDTSLTLYLTDTSSVDDESSSLVLTPTDVTADFAPSVTGALITAVGHIGDGKGRIVVAGSTEAGSSTSNGFLITFKYLDCHESCETCETLDKVDKCLTCKGEGKKLQKAAVGQNYGTCVDIECDSTCKTCSAENDANSCTACNDNFDFKETTAGSKIGSCKPQCDASCKECKTPKDPDGCTSCESGKSLRETTSVSGVGKCEAGGGSTENGTSIISLMGIFILLVLKFD